MGREIRRVSEGWEHPRDHKGNLQPLYDETFEDAFKEWQDNLAAWLRGEAEYQRPDHARTAARFTQYYGCSPDPDMYRIGFDNADHYQIYETVTEGTPVSPVFASHAELEAWLITQGHSTIAATRFTEHGSVPSMIVDASGVHVGIDALDTF